MVVLHLKHFDLLSTTNESGSQYPFTVPTIQNLSTIQFQSPIIYKKSLGNFQAISFIKNHISFPNALILNLTSEIKKILPEIIISPITIPIVSFSWRKMIPQTIPNTGMRKVTLNVLVGPTLSIR
jgi:hypothetical protein